jgi:Kef-type K+ transport system membrane component KefB
VLRVSPPFEDVELRSVNAAAVSAGATAGWIGPAVYLALIVGGVGLFLIVRAIGDGLDAPPAPVDARPVGLPITGQADVVLHVTATLAVVIALGTLLARLFRYVGQPPVIGEVVAGILLGPSLLGAISPDAMHLLIPSRATDPHGQVPAAMMAVSQLGVILYMFLVGLDLNAARLAGKARAAMAVSHSSIIAPFLLGSLLALGLYPAYSHRGVPFTSFALFMGVAMAITAFPVLARILTDRNLDKTRLGSIALSCAAADDVTAWCLLALVVGVAQASMGHALLVVGGAIAFIAFMFFLVQPVLRRVVHAWDAQPGDLPPLAISGTFMAVLACAFATEAIGIHAVFGAFLLGAIIPHDCRIAVDFNTKLKETVTVLLLPAFFAYTGMRMQIGLLSGWTTWMWCGAVILAATAGKFGGTLIAARLTGLNWRDSVSLGALMNTRGLMELIVLNIGLDLGVISPTLFAMMVVMALVTTAMTAPVVNRLIPDSPSAA